MNVENMLFVIVSLTAGVILVLLIISNQSNIIFPNRSPNANQADPNYVNPIFVNDSVTMVTLKEGQNSIHKIKLVYVNPNDKVAQFYMETTDDPDNKFYNSYILQVGHTEDACPASATLLNVSSSKAATFQLVDHPWCFKNTPNAG